MSGGRLRACVGAACVVVLGLAVAPARAAQGMTAAATRYSLPVGRELTYLASDDYQPVGPPKNAEDAQDRAETKARFATHVDVRRLTVVRENADGSRRMVEQIGQYTRGADGRPQGDPSQVQLVQWDMFPDGRVVASEAVGRLPLLGPLPPEPGDVVKGWVGSSTLPGESLACIARTPASGGGEFLLAATEQGAMTRIGGGEPRKATYRFDPIKGVITSSVYDFGVGWTVTNRLDSDRVVGPAELATVAADFDRFFAAEDEYNAMIHRAEVHFAQVDAILAEARAVVAAAGEQATQDATRRLLAEELRQHDDYRAKYNREAAGRLANLLDHPAADWASTDLDGRPVRLSDFRGKVVVMDFWYRNCPKCIFAMPQVKQLAEDFKGRPVVVLGMSVDENEKDARLVADVMRLAYPTVKARGINEKYGFYGFPALLVVDRAGVARAFHDGYSPTLRQGVGKEIEELLNGGQVVHER